MKRKRKVTNARSTPKTSAMSSGPSSSHPDLKNREPAENCVWEEDSSVDHDGKLETPHHNMDDETDNHQAGPRPSPSDATNPELSPPLSLAACYQGDHDGGNAGDNIVLMETSTAEITEQVSDGIAGNLRPVPIETAESNVICPNETDMAATGITETMEVRKQVNGDHQTSETSDWSLVEERRMTGDVNGDHQTSETSDCPLVEERRMTSDVNGCEAGDVSEMQLMDRNVPAFPEDASQEPTSEVQEASQNCQSLNETSDLPDLRDTPNIPEIASQSDLRDSQRIKAAPQLPDYDVMLQGRDGKLCPDPESQTQVIMSPKETWAKLTYQTPLCGGENIPSQKTEDPRGLTNGLDLPDSQLLVALAESFYESGKSVEHHIGDQSTPAAHREAIPPTTASPPRLSVIAAQDTRGPQQRPTEDASSTVQGLVMELSNINRLIMITYRELRQKRVRHTPGRGAASGRRRREM